MMSNSMVRLPKRMLNVLLGVLGAVALAILAFALNAVFSTRTTQTASSFTSSEPAKPSIALPTNQGQAVPPSDWRTFEYKDNPNLRYSIKYSPDWNLKTSPDTVYDFGSAWFYSPGKSSINSRVISISDPQWVAEDIKHKEEEIEEAKRSNLAIQGENALRVSGIFGYRSNPYLRGYHFEGVYLSHGGQTYFLQLVQAPEEENALKVFHTMLSTLSFSK